MSTPANSDAQLAQALTALRDMRARLESVETARREPIAIIGMSCRLPGAANPAELWQLLRDGGDAIVETPADRWDTSHLYDASPETAGKVATRWGGFLDRIDTFDAAFFGISPREAAQMDPQQRLFLEVAWEALEDGGQTAEHLAGSSTGVFVGVHSHSDDYYTMQAADPLDLDLYSGTGTSHSVVSGRLSYLLDLRGPSLAVDTACSSSLVAVHLAVQSLRNHESSTAIVGGVNALIDPTFTIVASRMRMMSASGRCRPFDAGADGFVRAEGCAVVVLKRLSDAKRDGDRVLAVIKGSAVNQDGHTNGLTAPNSLSQEAVLRAALADAGVSPAAVGLVETHGTGTPLGDPIEVEALAAVFAGGEHRENPLALGSLKANIGHAEGAAGVAAVVKTVLALRAGEVPPLVHFNELNPHISVAGTPFLFPRQCLPWPAGSQPRIAGVSSFGWSGTNAHVVLAESDDIAATDTQVAGESPAPALVLPISARSDDALRHLAASYRSLLADAGGAQAALVCANAALRRSHHDVRLGVAGRSAQDLVERLDAYLAGDERRGLSVGTARTDATVFVYPGQGSQWHGMARGLIAEDRSFRAELERCDEAIRAYGGVPVLDRLLSDAMPAEFDEIGIVQPLLFAVQVALTAMWRGRGVVPDAVVGHSMGEVAAAHVAGILSLDDAARVICLRSALLRRIAGRGAMAVVDLGEDDARAAITGFEDALAVAVVNSATSTVLSGDPEALDTVMARLDADGVFCRRVNVDVASHSPQVEQLLEDLADGLAPIRPRAAIVSFVSTVSGDFDDGTALDARYWARNLREPVRFADAVNALLSSGFGRFVEISPHPVLLAPIRSSLQSAVRDGAAVATTWRDSDEPVAIAAALGELFCDGASIDWCQVHPDRVPFVGLPTYPWQRERHWLPEASASQAGRAMHGPRDDELLGWAVPLAGSDVRAWERTIDRRAEPSWFEHRIGGVASLPASALLALMTRAAFLSADGATVVHDVRFDRLAVLDDEAPTRLQIVFDPQRGTRGEVAVSTWNGDRWLRHASALIGSVSGPIEDVPLRSTDEHDGVDTAIEHYRQLAGNGVDLGAPLRSIVAISSTAEGAESWITAEPPVDATLAAFDAMLQTAIFAVRDADATLSMPISIETLRIAEHEPSRMRCSVRVRGDVVDAWLVAADATPVCVATGIRQQRVDTAAARIDDWLYAVEWRASDRDRPDATCDAQPMSWVLLGDRGGVATSVADALRQAGMRCALLSPASATSGHGGFDDATVAAALVDASHAGPARLIHLCGLDTAGAPATAAALIAAQHDGVVTLLGAVRAAVKASAMSGRSVPVTVVTRGVHRVTPSDLAAGYAQATLWGLGRAIAEELPELAGGLIDVDPAASGDVARTASALVAALLSPSAPFAEREIALRGDARWVARLGRLAPRGTRVRRLRPDATYLVTGGFGSIGAHVARRLVRDGARRIALLGRTPLPSRDTWAAVATATPLGRRIALVRELEQLGAAVHTLCADAGDEQSLRAALQRFAAEGWPPIRGVHHAAAVFGGQFVTDLTEPELLDQLRPKLVGAWTLADELDDLDHFVLFSSIAAVMPIAGQGGYAAGNAFLDAFAAHLAASGRGALSVEWGFWEGSGDALDGEVGQRHDSDATVGYKDAARTLAEAQGMRGFRPDQALDALAMLTAPPTGAAMVLPIDWAQYADAHAARVPSMVADLVAEAVVDDAAVPGSRAATLAEQLASSPAGDHADIVDAMLRRVLGQVLKLPESRIGDAQPFGTLGLDSLMAIEVRNRLERETGITMSATMAWNYPTVRELRGHVLARLGFAVVHVEAHEPPAPQHTPAMSSRSASRIGEATAAVAALSDDDALMSLLGEVGE
ncbi:MAG: SDR family NAD(P)-dependent oxidoreductase [Ilumatobacteraceae bacterium]